MTRTVRVYEKEGEVRKNLKQRGRRRGQDSEGV